MSVFRLSVVAGLAVWTGVACAGDGTGLPDAEDGDEVKLSEDVQPILSRNCEVAPSWWTLLH